MRFKDREDSGKRLGEQVARKFSLEGQMDFDNCLVVGLPRGGVPVAFEVARSLQCPLEIIMSKKLPYPGQPEYAIGAVSSDGVLVLNPEIPEDRAWQAYINQHRVRLLYSTSNLERQFYELAGRKRPSSFKGKTVIIVDDGVATGMTAIAAIRTARKRGAIRTIMAAPVMSRQSYDQLCTEADTVIALSVPEPFQAVGLFYVDFMQSSDEDVIEALRQSKHTGNGSDSYSVKPVNSIS